MLLGPHALPAARTIQDCADYTITVKPFLYQLQTLPQDLYHALGSVDNLKHVYLATNPLVFAFAFALALAPVVLVAAEVNKNYSQVDRLWSILPALYIGHYTLWAHLVGLPTQKLDYAAVFGFVWSSRLTFNYWRKGGYSIGSEDYRWAIIKEKIGPTLMFLFDVVFISLAQSVLLFLITTPAYILLLTSRLSGEKVQLTTADTIFPRILLGLVLFEFFADQQQWNYQQAKKQYQATAKVPHKYNREDLDRGFITDGLWAFSRHPNFAAEQSIWLVFYQWAVTDSETWYNWTLLGAMCYVFLFAASTWFTELVSAKKYPEYKEYQRLVGRFVPKSLGGGREMSGKPKSEGKKDW